MISGKISWRTWWNFIFAKLIAMNKKILKRQKAWLLRLAVGKPEKRK